ncbi:hypothetical protein STIAU_6653, partial [Stigmatella aurantiaca DW4/3-1]
GWPSASSPAAGSTSWGFVWQRRTRTGAIVVEGA